MPCLFLGTGPVYTLNSDYVWSGPNPLRLLGEAWDPARMDGLMLMLPASRATGYRGPGDLCLARDGRLELPEMNSLPALGLRGCADHQDRWPRGCSGRGVFGQPLVAANVGPESIVRNRLRGRLAEVGYPESVKLAEAVLANGTTETN